MTESVTFQAGNLAHGVTEADLRAVFAPLGDVVSIKVSTDRRGRPKGIASIEMRVAEAPERVLEQLRGARVADRVLDVWQLGPEMGRGGPGKTKRKRR